MKTATQIQLSRSEEQNWRRLLLCGNVTRGWSFCSLIKCELQKKLLWGPDMPRYILSRLLISQLTVQHFFQCKCSYNSGVFMSACENAASLILLPLGHIWWHHVCTFSQTKRDHCNDSGGNRKCFQFMLEYTHTHTFIYTSLYIYIYICLFTNLSQFRMQKP